MTLSKQNREDNIEYALRLMKGKLGDRAMFKEFFDSDDQEFAGVHPTTWKELESKGLVRAHRTLNSADYELLGPGWYCAMAIDDLFDTPEFQEPFGKLSAALKKYVDGRQEEGITSVSRLVEETGLTEDWIYNVITGKIWEYHMKRVGARLDGGEVVWIPIDFNMEHL
jgi:hypothetical protein